MGRRREGDRRKMRKATAFGSDTNLSHIYILLNKNKVRKTHCEEKKKGGVEFLSFNSESLIVPFLPKTNPFAP